MTALRGRKGNAPHSRRVRRTEQLGIMRRHTRGVNTSGMQAEIEAYASSLWSASQDMQFLGGSLGEMSDKPCPETSHRYQSSLD